ncbi:MAG: hypothetical protein JNL19_02140 [Burkholderiales bacterium]|nr:hypothetical protein [Burkholderiales bacterium]
MAENKGNEPWAAWAESMQKMLATPGAMNPFAGVMGASGGGAAPSGFDPAQLMKALDPDEIERRIQDMRAVEAWMRLALSGVEMSIKTMEMQRDAYASFGKMRERATRTVTESAEAAAAVVRGATRGAEPKRAARRASTRKR